MLHTFHLVRLKPLTALRHLLRRPVAPGLRRVEVMSQMRLGAGIISPERLQLRQVAVFAEWEDDDALRAFLTTHPLGRELERGWYVRMRFLRKWGGVKEFNHLPQHTSSRVNLNTPMVAVTLARSKFLELPRFIRWGRPVERQIRDNPHAVLALAAVRTPLTFSTFSIWTSGRAMTEMAFGRGEGEQSRLHHEAMTERDRRDFHREFTTLRFTSLSEHGVWQGRGDWIPTTKTPDSEQAQ